MWRKNVNIQVCKAVLKNCSRLRLLKIQKTVAALGVSAAPQIPFNFTIFCLAKHVAC